MGHFEGSFKHCDAAKVLSRVFSATSAAFLCHNRKKKKKSAVLPPLYPVVVQSKIDQTPISLVLLRQAPQAAVIL